MRHARTLFIAAALIAGPLSVAIIPSDIAHAQCALADQCSQQVCRQRHNVQDRYCNRKRSCVSVNVHNTRRLNNYLTRNEQCLEAREAVARCFSVIDQGHQDAIDQAENAIHTCRVKLGLD